MKQVLYTLIKEYKSKPLDFCFVLFIQLHVWESLAFFVEFQRWMDLAEYLWKIESDQQ